MSDERAEFEELMRRVREGCPQATQELFDRYSDHIRRLVRVHLNRRLRRVYDSQDVLQSVWASFFKGQDNLFNTPEELRSFLLHVAQHKVVNVYRRHCRTLKRPDAHELRSIQGPIEDLPPDVSTHQPTPSQLAIAEERWENLVRDQPPLFRRILEMLRAGHTHLEIATELDLHPKAIQRLVRKLDERLGRA